MKRFDGYERGINLGGWISQYNEASKTHFDTFITKTDITRIASWGLDHVRLPVDYEVVMDDDLTFKEDGFSYIDACLSWCREYRLNVILDLHKSKGYMFDALAVPDSDKFFTESALQDAFYHIWREFARRYGKYSSFLTFELLNEVVNPAYGEKWNEIATECIKEVRAIAPDNTIIIGGTCNNAATTVSAIRLPSYDNIVLTFHCYEPMAFTHQKAYWVMDMPMDQEVEYPLSIEELREKSKPVSKAQVGAIFDTVLDGKDECFFETLFADAISYAKSVGAPLYCGEYGVIDRAPAESALHWFQAINKTFTSNQIGRSAWNYKEKDFGIVDAHYDGVRDKLVKYL